MATIVKMPKWGLTMTQGTIVDWLVAEGTEVAEGDMILTVETEKAVDDVGAPASGILYRIVAPAGSEVAVSGPIGVIVEAGESLSEEELAALLEPSATPAQAGPSPAESRSQRRDRRPSGRDSGGRINASPAAKKLAAELGIDLSTVEATGPGGRITSDDVQRAAEDQIDPAPVDRMVDLDGGRRIHLLQAGPASPLPLIFVHGLGGSLSSWQLVMGSLSADHRMTAVDLPGHGRSGAAVPDPSIGGLASDIAAALRAIHAKPSVIVGHSLGGAVAMSLALDHPDLVAALVLIDGAGLGLEIAPELISLMAGPGGPESARGLLSLFFEDQKLVTDRGVEEMASFHADGAWAAQQAVASAAFGSGTQQPETATRRSSIDRPVLLIWGANDRVIPVEHAFEAVAVFPDALLKVLPGIGHVPQVEQPAIVATAIDRFVRSLV